MSKTTGAADTLEKKLTGALSRAEARLVEETRTAAENTTEVVSHLHAAGGKRMRPLLVLLVSQLDNAGGDTPISEDLIAAGMAVELIHSASLYHDDLIDDVTICRGATAAHVEQNSTLAMMAGDLIFARVLLITSDFGRGSMRYHARTFQRLCLGQVYDILGLGATDDPIDFYLHILREKTGPFIGTAALYDAALSGYSFEICTVVIAFGEGFGVAFQITDDVLDLCSTTTVSRETPGADLRDGTKTLPVSLLEKSVTARGASDVDRYPTKMIEDHRALSADAALSEVVDRFAEHRMTWETVMLAETWVGRAPRHLAIPPEGTVRTTLTGLSRQQVNRLHQLSACCSAAECTGDYDHPHLVSATEGTTVNAHTAVNCVGMLDDSAKTKVSSGMYAMSGRVGEASTREGYKRIEGHGDLACIWNIETYYVVTDVEIWYPAPL